LTSANSEFHIERIESKVLPAITVLAYDASSLARTYGEIEAQLYRRGVLLADPDLQMAATALHHGLDLVTGNVRHFERVPSLTIARVPIESRRRRSWTGARDRATTSGRAKALRYRR
jgi:predicted nucleic acid-binding protein